MSFTTDIKREIIARGVDVGGRKAALSALLRTSGDVGLREGQPAFYFVSETENVAEFFMTVFGEEFDTELYVSHATQDKMSGKAKLVIECPTECAMRAAKGLGLVKRTGELRDGISPSLVATEEGRLGYICGAFLGSGSCTVPAESGTTGYHLECIFSSKKIARDFCRLLTEMELIPKLAERKDSFVVYIKSKELISDFLAVIGAENCLKKFSSLVEKRDKANNDNRARNCMAGNADKVAIAAVKQVRAIEKLKAAGGLDDLSEELRTLAELRLRNPTMSLLEMGQALGVSKSCLNHRMRKLIEISEREKRI